jgi:hypothetical protein
MMAAAGASRCANGSAERVYLISIGSEPLFLFYSVLCAAQTIPLGI